MVRLVVAGCREVSSENSLREMLRTSTAGLHSRLDAVTGDLSSVAMYRAFVARSYVFRRASESAVTLGDWPVLSLAGTIRRDLEDLQCDPVDIAVLDPQPGKAANIGRLYVLEGSALGARILYKQALRLGFTATHGARHLARQANDPSRWKNFVALLESVQADEHAEILRAAKDMFEFAIRIYSQGVAGP